MFCYCQSRIMCSHILDKAFLAFFFKRLKVNSTGKYSEDFPFVSPCGREMNYIRCYDCPIVFQHILLHLMTTRLIRK